MSKFKTGQTIPAKFVLKNAAGASCSRRSTRRSHVAPILVPASAAALENPASPCRRTPRPVQKGRQSVSLQLDNEGHAAGPLSHLREPCVMARPARWTSASRSRRVPITDDGSGCICLMGVAATRTGRGRENARAFSGCTREANQCPCVRGNSVEAAGRGPLAARGESLS